MTLESRTFRLDPHALSMLIQAQAGSLQKAVLEAVANALDAGATQASVTLTPERVLIEDDGRGFPTKDDIDRFFDNFGFDHSQLDRTVGRFGVGRGQLFHFGKNLWTTHGFTMAVDSRSNMNGYDLGVAKVPHAGVKIAIDLYEKLGFSALATTEAELKKLVRFCTIPVLLNGKAIQKSPETVTWDAETDDAWFKMDDSYELKVYSQGLFVQSLPARQFGKGGVVVTKLGHPLKQNMARNDLLATDCPTWKRVRKTLMKLGQAHQEKASASTSMTEPMRASMADKACHGKAWEAFERLSQAALFTLTNGRHVRLPALLANGYVACAPNKDPSADVLIQRKQASIINPQTLHRFGVESVAELYELLKTAVSRYAQLSPATWTQTHAARELSQALDACVFKEKVADLPMQANVTLTEVKDRETQPDEKLALALIRRQMMPALTFLTWNALHPDQTPRHRWSAPEASVRRVQLATSEAFLACTDGASKIWIDRSFLRRCLAQGAEGFTALAHTLVHELLHDLDSSVGHDHDHEFYQHYHDLTIDGAVASMAMSHYASFLARGGTANATQIKKLEAIGRFDSEAATDRMAARSDPAAARARTERELVGEELEVTAAAPSAKRRGPR